MDAGVGIESCLRANSYIKDLELRLALFGMGLFLWRTPGSCSDINLYRSTHDTLACLLISEQAEPVFISFIDSTSLPRQLGDWKLLRAEEQHAAYNVQRVDDDGHPYGKDSWYKDEILAIRSIPREAIINTITMAEIRGWSGYPKNGFVGWANIEMRPRLKRKLNLELNPFVGNLWDD